MNINRKKIFGWIKILIIVYCSIGIALYYLQEKFLFHPKQLSSGYRYKFDRPFEELSVPVNKDDTISLVKFFPKDTAKAVVIYYHGNMENINHYAAFADNFTKQGYEVWMPDYPGFGKTTGERSEQKLYEQAVLVQKMAASRFDPEQIIIYGKSLGTGIATYVASVSRSKRLILETPYYSIPDLFNSYALIYPSEYMSNYKIPTWKYLQDVTEPVTIFHGTKDAVIFYRCSSKLKKYLKPGDQFITIDGGKHNNLAGFKLYRQVLDSLLNE